jgi:hypothetical protein
MKLTEILVKEGTRSDDDAVAASSCGMCGAYMGLGSNRYVDPVSLAQ